MLRLVTLLLPLALLAAACGEANKVAATPPVGFDMPSACVVANSFAAADDGSHAWVLRCEDSEHIFMPDEAHPLIDQALFDGGWWLCGAAAGTSYYLKGNYVTTLAFAQNDRRSPDFGKVYLGQKSRTVECP